MKENSEKSSGVLEPMMKFSSRVVIATLTAGLYARTQDLPSTLVYMGLLSIGSRVVWSLVEHPGGDSTEQDLTDFKFPGNLE